MAKNTKKPEVKAKKKSVEPIAKKVAVEKVVVKEEKKKATRVQVKKERKLKQLVSIVVVIILILAVIFGVQWLVTRPKEDKKTTPTPTQTPIVVEKEEDNKEVVSEEGFYINKDYQGSSIAEALKGVATSNSYYYRVLIAYANGIEKYQGTVKQNLELVELLKTGKLKSVKLEETYAKSNYQGTSIVDALELAELNSSYYNRAILATANGIENYRGTASQNTELLKLLQEGKLKKVVY